MNVSCRLDQYRNLHPDASVLTYGTIAVQRSIDRSAAELNIWRVPCGCRHYYVTLGKWIRKDIILDCLNRSLLVVIRRVVGGHRWIGAVVGEVEIDVLATKSRDPGLFIGRQALRTQPED